MVKEMNDTYPSHPCVNNTTFTYVIERDNFSFLGMNISFTFDSRLCSNGIMLRLIPNQKCNDLAS